MIKVKDLTIGEVFQIADLIDKMKHADMDKKTFIGWYEMNKDKVFPFIKKEDDRIIAFMILKVVSRKLEAQMLIHSVYVPSDSQGISDEFYEKLTGFCKYLGITKARARMLRKPEGTIKKWGFTLESYNLTKEMA